MGRMSRAKNLTEHIFDQYAYRENILDNIPIGQYSIHMAQQPENAIIRQTPETLTDRVLDTDAMYNLIGKTVSALDTVTAGGANTPSPEMQAHTHSRYLPATEREMILTNAVPASDAEVKAIIEMAKRKESVQYRQEQLKIPDMTLTEITGARIRVAYRLIRYMSHVRGIGSVGTPLIMSMASNNTQVNLFEVPRPFNPVEGWGRGLSAVRNLLACASEGPYRYTYLFDGEVLQAKGMSIMPPPIHDGYFPQDGSNPLWKYRREQYTPPEYRADTDAPMAIYLNICELLVRHLGIGEDQVPEQAAVAALLNPAIARLAWPCSDDIETFEEYRLMPYIGRIMSVKSHGTTVDVLKQELSLTHSEAHDLVECYKTFSQYVNVFDPERERSVMLGRLAKLTESCEIDGMVTTQHNSMKTTLQVLGLTKHEDESNVDRRAGLVKYLDAEVVEPKQEIIVAKDDG